jgi:DNA-directed RNA polymerase I subunit RPA49
VNFRYALGVFDRSDGSLKVAPVQGNRVLRMEPRARDLDYSASAAISPGPTGEKSAADIQARRERNARLVEEFGSQRRKRQLAAAKSAQVEAAQVSGGEAVLGMIASAGADLTTRDAMIAASLANNRNIPTHHPEAITAEEAYRLDEIVPQSVADALEIRKLFPAQNKPEYREELLKAKVFGEGYVLSRLSALDTPDVAIREGRAQCLVLLGHLLKIINGPGGGNAIRVKHDESIANAADRLRMESTVLEGILDLFYSHESSEFGDRYILSKEKRTLMVGWMLILAIRAEPQCVLEPGSFAALATELKMRGGDVGAQYRELGCVTMRVNGLGGGTKVTLMPHSSEEKTLANYFPGLKLGGKKPGGR